MKNFIRTVYSIARGVWQFRHPQALRWFGEQGIRLRQTMEVRNLACDLRIGDSVLFEGYQPGVLTLGERVQIREGSVLAFGDERNGIGTISIGSGTWIGQYNNLRAGGGDIHIGRDCLISQFCSIVASNHAHVRGIPIQSQGAEPGHCGVVIGDDVWLGAGGAVMPGVSISDDAVIGANAVVTCDVPNNQIWAGVPACKIGMRE